MLRNADGGGGVTFPGKKRYEGVRLNVNFSVYNTRGWLGVIFVGGPILRKKALRNLLSVSFCFGKTLSS